MRVGGGTPMFRCVAEQAWLVHPPVSRVHKLANISKIRQCASLPLVSCARRLVMPEHAPVLLSRSDVARLLTIEECIAAIEDAFAAYGRGEAMVPKVLGVHVEGGGFHIKSAVWRDRERLCFVTKTNANFPANPQKYGLPTIQGVVLLFDATNGVPLAVMDSMELTIQRTAAATGVAAKYLARRDSSRMALCGCGAQAAAQLAAIRSVLPIRECAVFDVAPEKARSFATAHSSSGFSIRVASSAADALQDADVCVTCTPSREAFITPEMVRPGMFIAAVGADNPEKQEIDPQALRRSKVVVDVLEQCATIGDLHHAIEAGVMTSDEVHGELGAVVAGKTAGRESEDEVIVFDSTGMALQDAAAACAVYRKAVAGGNARRYEFGA